MAAKEAFMSDGLYLPDGSFPAFFRCRIIHRACHAPERGRFYGELEGLALHASRPDPCAAKRGDDASILAGAFRR